MKFLTQIIDKYFNFTPHKPLPAGSYHYQAPADSTAVPFRLHLRLEPDGAGLLVVNARTVLHLNPTAAEYAYHFIKRTPADEVAAQVSHRYNITAAQALQDFTDLAERFKSLINTPDLDPVTYLDFDRSTPYAGDLSAPLRLDCALTYRLSEEAPADSTPQERVRRELTTDEWKSILDKAAAAGIPHVLFTGGEPTLRPDLPELIQHCEQHEMVAGLLTDGLRLSETAYLHELLQTGLDHLMISFDPDEDQAWEGLRDALVEDIFVTVHLTVTPQNADRMPELLRDLAVRGVTSLSLSISTLELKDILADLRQQAAALGLSLVWDLPVPYSALHPVALEQVEAESMPDGAARAWLYVEPDGDVLPAQGVQTVLGNLLSDPWQKVWEQARAHRAG